MRRANQCFKCSANHRPIDRDAKRAEGDGRPPPVRTITAAILSLDGPELFALARRQGAPIRRTGCRT
ncbi:hypothetical protein VTK26DRAFT_674 [Humicola hyalothermophila]